jgi:hypothetical protein
MKDIITSKNATFSFSLSLLLSSAYRVHIAFHDIIKCLKEIFKFIKTLFTPFSLTFSLFPPRTFSWRNQEEKFCCKSFLDKKEKGGRKENEK